MTCRGKTVLSNEPKSWLEHKADSILPPAVIGPDIEFDETKDQYRKRDERKEQIAKSYGQALQEREKFSTAMKSFQDKLQTKINAPIDNGRGITLYDVIQTMGELYGRHEEGKGFAQNFFNKLGESYDAFNAWLGILPDGEYSSVICGAFKLVIRAAARAKAVRDTIFEALGAIPATLKLADRYRQLWTSPELDSEHARLYISILQFFESMFKWLSESELRVATKILIQQDHYEKAIQKRIDIIKRCVDTIREQALLCQHAATRTISESMKQQKEEIDSISNDTRKINDFLQRKEGRVKVINHYYVILKSRKHDYESSKPTPAEAYVKGMGKFSGFTPDALCKALSYDSSLMQSDVEKVDAEGHIFSLAEQERADHLLSSHPYEKWFTSPGPGLLFINANVDPGRISPASFACAMLADSLPEREVLTLSFFCGLHTDPRDKEAGVKPMLANLVAQLLEKCRGFNLSFLTLDQKAALMEYDTDLLCEVLKTLTRQLSKGHLIIFTIDGISFYETARYREDLLLAIAAFNELASEYNGAKAVVKILLSSPTRSSIVARELDQDQIYTLPPDIELTNQGFNSIVHGRKSSLRGREPRTRRRNLGSSSSSDNDTSDSE